MASYSQMIYIPPTQDMNAPHESKIKLCRLDSLLIQFLERKKKFSQFFWKFTCYIYHTSKCCWRCWVVCCWLQKIDRRYFMESLLAPLLLSRLIQMITHNLILFITTKEIVDCTSFRFLMMILEQTKYDFIW